MDKKVKLIKDLSHRLPYGVKVLYTGNRTKPYSKEPTPLVWDLIGVDIKTMTVKIMIPGSFWFDGIPVEDVKPYLRNFDDMTDVEDAAFAQNQVDVRQTGYLYAIDAYRLIEFLYCHHIDFLGLISDDLAVEVTKENNPYTL